MERKIGETFEYYRRKLKVMKGVDGCTGCYFKEYSCRNNSIIGECIYCRRNDHTGVIFVDITDEPEENLQAEQPQQEVQQEAEETKEREIGEVFEYEGKKLKVVETKISTCHNCYFSDRDCDCENTRKVLRECTIERRTDHKPVIFVEVKDEQPQEEQPQELNLCEVLKYCPQGETFWSPMLGDVKLNDIDQETKKINVILASGATWDINADGTITIGNVTSQEVMLYPSSEQMAWTKVKYEKKKELPRTWEEFCKNYERKKGDSYIDLVSKICTSSYDSGFRDINHDRNILPSKQAAEAHLAYMQLHQLRDAWREEWLPDWTKDSQDKFAICSLDGEILVRTQYIYRHFLTFQDEKRAKEFLKCHIDLIRKAGDLI